VAGGDGQEDGYVDQSEGKEDGVEKEKKGKLLEDG
jgi:hypothetical protein